MIKKTRLTAKQFYESIKKEEKKYVLVNDLFICKYINDVECYFIGDLWKPSQYDINKVNRVIIHNYPHPQRFRPKESLTHTRMDIQNKYPTVNFWKPLRIGFKEKPIKNILK